MRKYLLAVAVLAVTTLGFGIAASASGSPATPPRTGGQQVQSQSCSQVPFANTGDYACYDISEHRMYIYSAPGIIFKSFLATSWGCFTLTGSQYWEPGLWNSDAANTTHAAGGGGPAGPCGAGWDGGPDTRDWGASGSGTIVFSKANHDLLEWFANALPDTLQLMIVH